MVERPRNKVRMGMQMSELWASQNSDGQNEAFYEAITQVLYTQFAHSTSCLGIEYGLLIG